MKGPVKIYGIAVLMMAAVCVFAQDPTFSQFDANQLYYNPAYAGYKEEGRITATYRNLWPNVPGETFPGPLATYSLMGDAYVSIQGFNAGIGGFVMQDVEGQGYLTTTTAGVMYSQHMPHLRRRGDMADRFDLYLGFKAYYSNLHIDWSRFVFSDQLDPNYGIIGPSSFTQTTVSSRSYFDFDFGGVIRNNFKGQGRWYNEIGFAMAHVLAPVIAITGSNADDARLPRKYTATYRSTVSVMDDNFFVGPSVLFENQAKFYEMNAGVDFYMKFKNRRDAIPLSIGIYNRFTVVFSFTQTGQTKINTSAIILSIAHHGYFAGGRNSLGYSVGFSVDLPYMGLGMQTAGAYEATFGITIPYTKSNKLKCPFQAF